MEKLGPGRSKEYEEYFIAIIPPGAAIEEAAQLKEYFKERYNSKASLNSPPHITLHMPFRWLKSKESVLVEKLAAFFSEIKAFPAALRDFGSFPPRVIFIKVEENANMTALQQQLKRYCKQTLNLYNADYREKPFHAHLTLAFRDLNKTNYEEAWLEFSQRKLTHDFQVTSIALLKHDGKFWQAYRAFGLKNY